MKATKLIFFFLSLVLLFGCSENKEKSTVSREALKLRITQLEDSISKVQNNPETVGKIKSLTNIELINRLTDYYRAFPQDAYSADCLFKIHMKFSELNAHDKSVAYGDTLLKLFPNYENKEFLIESIASAYDVYILPRDTSKVRKYYTLLLKLPNINSNKKQDIQKRLDNLNLSFDDYILKLNNLVQ
jgi:hypothetical protein